MWRLLTCAFLISQVLTVPRPSIVANASGPPRPIDLVLYYDEAFLFAGRGFGNSRDIRNTKPGLFVHSRQYGRWIQVLQISTYGGKFGKSLSNDPEEQKKLQRASVSWDFTPFATRDYIEQPLQNPSSISFPERIEYRPESARYELRYMTSWGVPSAETVLYINRRDLLSAFEKSR